MLDFVIRFSLKHRLVILALAIGVLVWGFFSARNLPVDVFPDLNRPTVAILTEAHGLAPEEVETLVTLPLESVLNGTPGVLRVRSSSGIGISILHVEFEWGTDVFRNRQLVAERLQLARERLPKGMIPTMGPITSIMGEIQFVGLTSVDGSVPPMELRTLADWIIRPRLLTVPGISQVIVMGGEVKQYHVLVSPEKLQKRGLGLEDMAKALELISMNTTGGFLDKDGKEYLIRPLGRLDSLEQIAGAPMGMYLGKPVYVKDVAKVSIGARAKRGEASINGQHAVVMTIQKQPEANTIDLTRRIDALVEDIQKSLPPNVKLEGDLFKQSRFIEAAISNVTTALRDGAIIVAVILFLFLANLRTTAIALVTIPLSLLATAIVFQFMGVGLNTMTLGGLAVAIGELVDDAIVGMENVFRRLRENKANGSPKGPLRVIFEASSEVRNSIIFATIIVILVFIPMFFLGGIEGRLFAPLGVAYVVSLFASLVVSLTVTPALCSYLLPNFKHLERPENPFVRRLKNAYQKTLKAALYRPGLVLAICGGMLAVSLSLLPFMGRNFLPPFNEGTATIGVGAAPGISLAASDELGTRIEKAMLEIPEVKSTIRRTGRAEMDEHAEGVHWSEIDVDFKEGGRPRPEVLDDLRKKILSCGDVYVNVGQPISHRLDHLLSGVRAQIAVKIFGPDLSQLGRLGGQAGDILKDVPGLVDFNIEPLVPVPQIKIAIDPEAAGRFGLRSGALAENLEIALHGETVGQILEGTKVHEIFLRLDESFRNGTESIAAVPVKTLSNGKLVRVEDLADVYEGMGPNMVNREDMQKRIVLSGNARGRDLGSLAGEIMKRLKEKLELPPGYYWVLGGQFENQIKATRLLFGFGLLSLLAIALILRANYGSWMITLQILLNIPLALIGSVVAVFLTERVFSVATLVAFITLCGIVSRNGIMMISHYLHLLKEEGEVFGEKMVLRGSLERLSPVLMTALCAALALIPFILSKGEAGKEILYPVAVVIVGGLVSSTFLVLVVTPVVFFRYGRRSAEKAVQVWRDKNSEGKGDWK